MIIGPSVTGFISKIGGSNNAMDLIRVEIVTDV
jgi:hypothetical protein